MRVGRVVPRPDPRYTASRPHRSRRPGSAVRPLCRAMPRPPRCINERTFRRCRNLSPRCRPVRFGRPSPSASLRRSPVAEIERTLGLYCDLYRGFTVKHFHEQRFVALAAIHHVNASSCGFSLRFGQTQNPSYPRPPARHCPRRVISLPFLSPQGSGQPRRSAATH